MRKSNEKVIFDLRNYSDYSKRIIATECKESVKWSVRGNIERIIASRHRINKTSFAAHVKVPS